ncbi:histidine kinase dimerization/phospho-acceptor domain-containing protein [Sulfuricystis multivorans]|uniref:histidine kinase dimerization/phospho-acceptor domain-containing protein n=1 Tax=Sulfuricystis multivorans TaxID=2211108 RepID=UPI001559DB51|nr:histidine kinase dimerization/phospho-acceptor domain-containing protein [Sulfuricystis multivorans]
MALPRSSEAAEANTAQRSEAPAQQLIQRFLSLRARLALSFAAFGAFVVVVLSLAIAYGAHDVARRLMDQTLSAEIEDYIARRARNPASLPPSAVGLRGFISPSDASDERQPPAVRALPPGRHEIVFEGTPYRVAIEVRDGWRYVILFDETRQKRREARFTAWLVGGALAVILLAFLGAWHLAGRALAPLSSLTAAIAQADVDRPPVLPDSGDPADELHTLAEAFRRYQTRLQRFVERERAFTADASHELRTPLAVIQGAAELLAHDETLSTTQRERAARIERACQRLAELVEALLLLAREETTRGECDAVVVAHETCERHAALCQQRRLRVALSAPQTLKLPIAAPLLAILIGNLLRNACEHAQSRVDIELTETALKLRDDGPGMSEEELAHAQERYWRGPESRGAGIGLALVARICELAGFSLQLTHVPEKGFIVEVIFSKSGGAAQI